MNVLKKLSVLEKEAVDFGFAWETTDQIMKQILDECAEVTEQLHKKKKSEAELEEEIGDLLHAVFSLCVFCHLDPKQTLEKTVEKFERRLKAVKAIAFETKLHSLHGLSFHQLMNIWDEAKSRVG